MSKLLLPTLSLFLAIWLLFGSWWYAKNYTLKGKHITKFESAIPYPMGQDRNSKANALYFFKRSSAKLILPKDADKGLRAIISHLNNHPSSNLDLIGLYTSSEVNHTEFKNLGIARAEALKYQFIKLGAPSNAISIQSLQVENIPIEQGLLSGSVLYSFSEDKKTNQVTRRSQQEDILSIRPLNLLYDNQKKGLKLTADLNEYFENLKYVLSQEPGSKIIITGHTDNVGSRKQNLKLSKSRATNVRNFMVDNGFKRKRLVVKYKGPDEPIASNKTSAGKKKNRRVEIRIK